MLSVSTLSELTTQCATRYYGPRTHSPATLREDASDWEDSMYILNYLNPSDPSLGSTLHAILLYHSRTRSRHRHGHRPLPKIGGNPTFRSNLNFFEKEKNQKTHPQKCGLGLIQKTRV